MAPGTWSALGFASAKQLSSSLSFTADATGNVLGASVPIGALADGGAAGASLVVASARVAGHVLEAVDQRSLVGSNRRHVRGAVLAVPLDQQRRRRARTRSLCRRARGNRARGSGRPASAPQRPRLASPPGMATTSRSTSWWAVGRSAGRCSRPEVPRSLESRCARATPAPSAPQVSRPRPAATAHSPSGTSRPAPTTSSPSPTAVRRSRTASSVTRTSWSPRAASRRAGSCNSSTVTRSWSRSAVRRPATQW